MENIFLFIFLFVILEVFELWWQKAPTLYEILENIYRYYQKSIFLVFLLHPTIYLSIYLMMISGYNIWTQIVFGLKLSDIALKLMFVKKFFLDQEQIDIQTKMMLSMKVENWMLYMGVVFYPLCLYMGFIN
ncbi:MAG: hypothetical protein GXO11_00515 [Epsilonproteobacteria bacterium]|nr:hypothetical protein [Campylobacterota bacterium]